MQKQVDTKPDLESILQDWPGIYNPLQELPKIIAVGHYSEQCTASFQSTTARSEDSQTRARSATEMSEPGAWVGGHGTGSPTTMKSSLWSGMTFYCQSFTHGTAAGTLNDAY